MLFKFFLPVVVGMSIVLQGTLNRSSTFHLSLASMILLNSTVFFILSAGFWLLTKVNVLSGGNLPSDPSNLQWWQFLPGIFGFVIVLCTPLAIKHLGANITFAIVICTQLFVSMVWDAMMSKHVPSTMSLAGVFIMIVGLGVLISGKN